MAVSPNIKIWTSPSAYLIEWQFTKTFVSANFTINVNGDPVIYRTIDSNGQFYINPGDSLSIDADCTAGFYFFAVIACQVVDNGVLLKDDYVEAENYINYYSGLWYPTGNGSILLNASSY